MLDKKIPKISVITPSFNQAQFLEATIHSVISQNYPNLEYIIIDGGSTDGSVEVIKKYESCLHFWCSEPDGGQYDAINKGFTHATGEILAWLNSDDIYCPWAFKTVSSIMTELPQVEWLTTLNPGYWDWYGFCDGFYSLPGYSKEAFLDGCYLPWNRINTSSIGWIQQESSFWRRSLWQKVGSKISTDFKMAGDFDLWSRFFLYADLYGTSSPLAGFRRQANQKTSQIEKYFIEAEASLINTRALVKWKQSFLRSILPKLKLTKVPKLRNMLTSRYGYIGKRVVRRNAESPSSYWEVEDYKFLDSFAE